MAGSSPDTLMASLYADTINAFKVAIEAEMAGGGDLEWVKKFIFGPMDTDFSKVGGPAIWLREEEVPLPENWHAMTDVKRSVYVMLLDLVVRSESIKWPFGRSADPADTLHPGEFQGIALARAKVMDVLDAAWGGPDEEGVKGSHAANVDFNQFVIENGAFGDQYMGTRIRMEIVQKFRAGGRSA